jgi:hypothetical protein
VCDINKDNWPDVYVSNDFLTNDLVWINNHDGTFTNKANEYLRHQTYNAMGMMWQILIMMAMMIL